MKPSFLLVLIFMFISTEQVEEEKLSCHRATTCSECLKISPDCGWCAVSGFKVRCDEKKILLRKECPGIYISSPQNQRKNILDEELSKQGTKTDKIIQLKPQKVHLKLRPKSPYTLPIKFKQSEDYPIDLYYLMDLSNSMSDDKDKLAELGNLLADRMGNITSNFRLGFGSFVDKVVMPYTSTVPSRLIRPCKSCSAPYGFKNHMSLSSNTFRFADEVKNAPVSGNLDGPEGGFDALMQAVICDQIGWRDNSRKLLVYSTDSSFHSAGDGKIGGILKPNDAKCHLDSNGYYSESSYQDYPSFSQLNKQIQKKKINIIFAVTAEEVETYTRVSERIAASFTDKLSDDSSNVVELVQDQYNRITSNVVFRDTAPDFVAVKYYSKCLGDKLIQTSKCENLRVGSEVQFEVVIEVLRCPQKKEDMRKEFTIYAVPLPSMTIDLEAICECDCEKPDKEEKDSVFCNNHGTYQCGICDCNKDRSGIECECEKSNGNIGDDSTCKRENDTISCSGNGECICGRCECIQTDIKQITGEYCECDNTKCERSSDLICSGPENGYCDCGKCICYNNWLGDACQCSKDKCIREESDLVCEGHGECTCEGCKCNFAEGTNERYDKETYCKLHPNEKKTCDDFSLCIQCIVHNSGSLYDEDSNCNGCSANLTIVLKDTVEDDKDGLCFDSIDTRCKFKHRLIMNDNKTLTIHAERKLQCEPDRLLAVAIGSIVGSIVLIGVLLLLIWKLLTHIHDRHEYAKFEREKQMAKWNEGDNPLFKGATSTFKNPTFSGK